LAKQFVTAGHTLTRINIGGGFPINFIDREGWDQFTTLLWKQLRGELTADQAVVWDNLPMGFAGMDRNYPERPAWKGKAYYSPYPAEKMIEQLLSSIPNGETEPFVELLRTFGEPHLYLEPGRGLIGTAGVTICEVAGTKEVNGNLLVVADMGVVNHSTALITADIHPMTVLPDDETAKPISAFIAGRLCFTGDMISKVKIKLNRLPQRGDILVIHHTGAYCADHFTSNSCGFPRSPKIAIDGKGRMELWRKPEAYADVFGVNQ